MRLCPDELCVNELKLGETLQLLETDGHQFTRLPFRIYPDFARQKVAVACATVLQRALPWQGPRDVAGGRNARRAHRQWVGCDRRPAIAACYCRWGPGDAVRNATRLLRLWL